MKTGLADFLLSLVVNGGGAVVGLARKGLGVLRALFGGVPGRLGALLKRVLAFAASKLSTGASAVRDGALASLRRRVEAVLRGEASEASEAEPASTTTAPSSSSCAASSPSEAPASTTTAASVAAVRVDGAARAPLSTLTPLFVRALVRVLQHPRAMRSGRAASFVLGAT